MATIDIVFNDKTYSIEESAFEAAAAALRTHFLSAMSGSGASINLGGTTYNIDSTKLSAATTNFVTHLGKISGSGSKVTVGGVEYSFAPSKVHDAIADLEVVLGDLVSGGNGGSSEELVFAEQTVEFEDLFDGLYMNSIAFTPVLGETYRVVWDGQEYVLTAHEEALDGGDISSTHVYLGNITIFTDGDDTGEPFLIMTGNETSVMTYDTASSHTVAIYKVSGGNGSVEGEVVIAEQTIQCEYMEGLYFYGIEDGGVSVLPGDTLRVCWDGTEYTCECYYELSQICFGNMAILGDAFGMEFHNTGEPFLMSYDNGYISIITNDTEPHTVSAYKIASKERSGENILEEKHYTFSYHEFPAFNAYTTYFDIDSNFDNFELVVGETYHVAWDGKEYTCVVATDNVGEPCMGNYALAGAGDDTGEPFFIIFDTGHPICIANDGAIKHLIGIYKVSGGNGGSSSIEGEVIIEENTYNEFFEAYTGVYTQWFDVELVAGETYQVVWDGLEYTMKALEAFEGGIFIGNSAILGYGDDNGYPFVIAYDEANYGQTVAATTEAGTSHTIGLYKISNGSGSDNLGEVVLAEMTYNGFSEVDGYDFYAPEDPDVFLIEFVEGETYRVIWDGVEYICTGYAQDELNGVGNASIVGYGDDTGEPFIISNNPFIRVATFDTASSHTIAIYKM